MTEQSPASTADSSAGKSGADEGPGCLPAFMAAGALLLMVMFIGCGFATWYIFQQRTELAMRTLTGDVIPTVRESGMLPEEKAQVVEILEQVVEDGKAGRLENWQSSAIMERLIKTPLLQWGDLEMLGALIQSQEDFSEEEKENAALQFSRLKRAVEIGEASAVDVNDVLSPVLAETAPTALPKLDTNSSVSDLRDTVTRAKLVADRSKIPDREFDVSMAKIIRREVEQGKTVGGF